MRRANQALEMLEKSPACAQIIALERGRLSVILVVLSVSMLSACASFTPAEVVSPKEVTISQALEDIGDGFVKMEQALAGKVLGLYPCQVNVTLNLKASAKDSGKLVIDLSSKPRTSEGLTSPADPAAKTGVEKEGEAFAERGNTIDLHMYNPGCLPKGTLGYDKPEAIGQAKEGMAFTGREGIAVTAKKDQILNVLVIDIERLKESFDNQSTIDASPEDGSSQSHQDPEVENPSSPP